MQAIVNSNALHTIFAPLHYMLNEWLCQAGCSNALFHYYTLVGIALCDSLHACNAKYSHFRAYMNIVLP